MLNPAQLKRQQVERRRQQQLLLQQQQQQGQLDHEHHQDQPSSSEPDRPFFPPSLNDQPQPGPSRKRPFARVIAAEAALHADSSVKPPHPQASPLQSEDDAAPGPSPSKRARQSRKNPFAAAAPAALDHQREPLFEGAAVQAAAAEGALQAEQHPKQSHPGDDQDFLTLDGEAAQAEHAAAREVGDFGAKSSSSGHAGLSRSRSMPSSSAANSRLLASLSSTMASPASKQHHSAADGSAFVLAQALAVAAPQTASDTTGRSQLSTMRSSVLRQSIGATNRRPQLSSATSTTSSNLRTTTSSSNLASGKPGLPFDLTIKSIVRFTSMYPFTWCSTLKSAEQAAGTASFVQQSVTPILRSFGDGASLPPMLRSASAIQSPALGGSGTPSRPATPSTAAAAAGLNPGELPLGVLAPLPSSVQKALFQRALHYWQHPAMPRTSSYQQNVNHLTGVALNLARSEASAGLLVANAATPKGGSTSTPSSGPRGQPASTLFELQQLSSAQVQHLGADVQADLAVAKRELQLWNEAFSSIYALFRNNLASYFYVVTADQTVLFTSAQVGGVTEATVRMSRSSRALRRALSDAEVAFQMPLLADSDVADLEEAEAKRQEWRSRRPGAAGSASAPTSANPLEADPTTINDALATGMQETEKEATASVNPLTEARMDAYRETLAMEREGSVRTSIVTLESSIENTPKSMLLFQGPNASAVVFDFILNSRLINKMASGGPPPLLYAPVAFTHASLQRTEIRQNSAIKRAAAASSSVGLGDNEPNGGAGPAGLERWFNLVLEGPIFPHTVYRLMQVFKATHVGNFEASLHANPLTIPLNASGRDQPSAIATQGRLRRQSTSSLSRSSLHSPAPTSGRWDEDFLADTGSRGALGVDELSVGAWDEETGFFGDTLASAVVHARWDAVQSDEEQHTRSSSGLEAMEAVNSIVCEDGVFRFTTAAL
ncbi:hypothetical protein CAOG_04782 [Capsaspora owczarzaki ATCC 30864]|uniref:Uncharacterized protein n=1 Tax=Capsaspora owczarzaki (strain ATCC 30864) TaxID=595528 RepID=A0A0D2WQT7_CAPO3|nr:hypothetical protein CAOG_04782 [Capsaspora owczarzaki ATCC 30864]KJE94090.1 hypothetical protein CAOG_004782 [Capsaspora owczarzaki ATCC 30864]|eukprot:XP_004347533.1 hypothetical protein CAOG_04782 [Capsaspora owczarzaki ATCC 30864]